LLSSDARVSIAAPLHCDQVMALGFRYHVTDVAEPLRLSLVVCSAWAVAKALFHLDQVDASEQWLLFAQKLNESAGHHEGTVAILDLLRCVYAKTGRTEQARAVRKRMAEMGRDADKTDQGGMKRKTKTIFRDLAQLVNSARRWMLSGIVLSRLSKRTTPHPILTCGSLLRAPSCCIAL
jgi:hypothetical protein